MNEEFDFGVCDWCGEEATPAVRITLENGYIRACRDHHDNLMEKALNQKKCLMTRLEQ